MENNWQDLLTWWESDEDSLRVECFHYRGAYRVRVLRAGHATAVADAENETSARERFERMVEKIASEIALAI